jgi:hypothetical protein
MMRCAQMLVLLAGTQGAAGAVSNGALCADIVMHQINSLVGFANTIVQTTVDCAPPVADEMSCASDVISIVGTLLDSTGMVLDMIATCGDTEYTCAHSATRGVLVTLGLSSTIVTVSGDCQVDPWLCAYDVVSLIDYLNGLAYVMYKAVTDCQQHDHHGLAGGRGVARGAVADLNVKKRYITGPYIGNPLSTMGSSWERRLQEVVDARKANATGTAAAENIDAVAAKLRLETRRVLSGKADLPAIPADAPAMAREFFPSLQESTLTLEAPSVLV